MNRQRVQGFTHFVKTAGNTFVSKLRHGRARTKFAPAASCRPSILSDPLPFAVPDGFIIDGQKLEFSSARDKYLPAIYEVRSHPRVPEDLRKEIKRILVIPWPKGDAQYLKFYFRYAETNINIPGGRNKTMPSLGWGKLDAGDIVFIRDIAGSGDGEDDTFEIFVGNIDEESEEGKMIKNLQDETLGSKADRSANGRTAFEKCSKRANPVGGSGRCYSCGMSHQKPRNLLTPAVGGKVRGKLSEEEEEHIQMRRNLVTTPIRLAVDMFRRLLPKEYNILETACELNNVPRIGTDDNVLYQGVQTNYSQPVHEDSLLINCIKALFFFGGKHFDKHDSPGGWTTMFSYPDIPTDEGWEGGRFHLVEFGLYVELDGIKSVTFTGLRLHGGTPPLAPAGVLIPPSAYRWVVVLYPQAATLDGRVALNIATASNGTPIQLTPEMRDTTVYGLSMEENDDEMPEKEAEQLIASGRELNFLDDGKIIMTPQTEVDFLARAFYEHTIYHQRQILGGGILRYEDYRKGWFIKRDGITYTAGPWRLAPDTLMLPKDKNFSPRQIAQAEWHEHCKHRVEVISSAFRNYKAPIKISAPQISGKITKAARAAQKRDAISRRKGRSKKKNANATILEIINAAQKAPQVVEFNQDTSQNQPKSKPKRKSVAESKRTRRSKRIKQNLDTIHQDPTSVQRNGSSEEEGEEIQVSAEEEQEVIYELRSILSHRVCTQACCNYEYFVEWADQETGMEEWIHEYQIDMGDMYTTYRHNAFTQVLDDLSPGPMDKEVEYPDRGHDELPIAEKNRSDSISFQSEHVADIAPFLMKVSRESLVSTICLLKEGIASKQAMEGSSIQDLFQKINRFHAALDHSPLDTRTMKAAVDVWPSITLLLTNSKVYDSSARIIHHTIMLTHYRLYTWVAESIEHVLDHPSSHWWYRVIKVVREVVERGIPGTFQFNSLEFLPTIQPPKTYTWIFQKRQHDQRTANILLASRIIFHWLGLPIESDDKHSAQSLFLRNLMDSCRTATVLLLNEVWDAYTMPSQLCSVHSKRAFPSKSAMKKLGQIFRDHPILGCNCSSEIQQLIDALQSAHCKFVGLPMSYHGPSPSIFM